MLTSFCPDSTSNKAKSFNPSLMSSNKSLTSSGGLHYKEDNRQMKLVIFAFFDLYHEILLVSQYIAKDEENANVMCEKQAC